MINAKLLLYELTNVGLPVVGVSSDGRIDYSRELNTTEQSTAVAVVSAHNADGKLPQEQPSRML